MHQKNQYGDSSIRQEEVRGPPPHTTPPPPKDKRPSYPQKATDVVIAALLYYDESTALVIRNAVKVEGLLASQVKFAATTLCDALALLG